MTSQAVRGFTIIEVVLFLAVTGLLTVGVLVGSGTAIAQQRYRDSVSSLKSLIQEQYNQTTNVVNDETSNPVCKQTGNSLVLDDSAQQSRGTSECLLLGRYLLIEPTKITAYDVIGRPLTDENGSDDIATLKNYTLGTSLEPETQEVSWGSTIVKPKTSTGLTTSLLILRSPLSGSVVTFVRDGSQKPSSMLNKNYMASRDLCVDPQGGSITGRRRLAVRINAGATSQSSIEIPLEKDKVCD